MFLIILGSYGEGVRNRDGTLFGWNVDFGNDLCFVGPDRLSEF